MLSHYLHPKIYKIVGEFLFYTLNIYCPLTKTYINQLIQTNLASESEYNLPHIIDLQEAVGFNYFRYNW